MLKANTIIFIVAASILAGVHIIALKLFLYWHYFWFDLPMHFLGGSVVVLGAFSFAELKIPYFYKIIMSPYAVSAFLVVVMAGWEVFEIWAGIPIEANFLFDTTLDVIMGTLGGFVGYFVATRVKEL
jgi:hypothetical protein